MKYLACLSPLSVLVLTGCGGGVTSTLDELTQKLNDNAFDELVNDLGQTQETSYGTVMQSMITSQPDGDYRLTLLLPSSSSIEEIETALTTNLSNEAIVSNTYTPEGLTAFLTTTSINGQAAQYLVYSTNVEGAGLGILYQPTNSEQQPIFIGNGSPASDLPSGVMDYKGLLAIQASDTYDKDETIFLDMDMKVNFSNSSGEYTSAYDQNGDYINVNADFKIETDGTFGGVGTVATNMSEDTAEVSWDITTLGSFHNTGATSVSGVYQSDDTATDGVDTIGVTGGFTASR